MAVTKKHGRTSRIVTIRCSSKELSLIEDRAGAAGLTVSAYLRRTGLQIRVPRRPAYLDNLTLHELSRLALAVDALERELTIMKIPPLASSRTVRELVQEHIDRMTQDDNSRKTPSAL
jgi:hypothetical protein